MYTFDLKYIYRRSFLFCFLEIGDLKFLISLEKFGIWLKN